MAGDKKCGLRRIGSLVPPISHSHATADTTTLEFAKFSRNGASTTRPVAPNVRTGTPSSAAGSSSQRNLPSLTAQATATGLVLDEHDPRRSMSPSLQRSISCVEGVTVSDDYGWD